MNYPGCKSLQFTFSLSYAHITANNEHTHIHTQQVGIEVKFKGMHYPVLISPSRVPELHAIARTPDGGVMIGGAASLSSVEHALSEIAEIGTAGRERGEGGGGAAAACVDMLRWFASTQIRNVACLAGEFHRLWFVPTAAVVVMFVVIVMVMLLLLVVMVVVGMVRVMLLVVAAVVVAVVVVFPQEQYRVSVPCLPSEWW